MHLNIEAKEASNLSGKLIMEIYEMSKTLERRFGLLSGLISSLSYCVLKMYYSLFSSHATSLIYQRPLLFKGLLLVSLLYTPLIIILLVLKFVLNQFHRTFRHHAYIVKSLHLAACTLLFPFELSVYAVKSVILILFTFNKDFASLFESDGTRPNSHSAVYYILFIALYVDFAVTIAICFMKCSILRPFVPSGGYFSKSEGTYEYFFIMLIPLEFFLFYLSNLNDSISVAGVVVAQWPVWTYFILQLGLMLLVTSIYLKELPYYHPLTERVTGHFQISLWFLYALKGVLQNNIDLALKIYLIIFPVQLASFEYFARFIYRIDYMDPKNTKNFKCLKKVLTSEWDLNDDFEQVYDQGVFMNYIKKKKNITASDKAAWYNIQKVSNHITDSDSDKEEKGAERSKSFHTSKLIKKNLSALLKPTIEEEQLAQRFEESLNRSENVIHLKETDQTTVKNKIANMIVNAFVDQNKKQPYAHLIRIYWMLNNRVMLLKIFKDIRELEEFSTNFKSRYICYYIKKEVEDYLYKLYKNPDMIYRQAESASIMAEKISYKNKDNMVDVAYVFYHKYAVQFLRTSIAAYSELNNRFLDELVETGGNNYQRMHKKVKTMYDKNQEIELFFNKYHKESRSVEVEHILPYSMHQSFNINFLRSGKGLIREYVKRMQLRQKRLDERNTGFSIEFLPIDSVTLLTDSDYNNLGTILDAYGDSERLLNISPKKLVGKSPNFLLPSTFAHFHDKVMQRFIKNELKPFFGEVRDSFIQIPESTFIMDCKLMVKMAPNIESKFKLFAAVKPNLKKQTPKMVLSSSLRVDCYSYSFLSICDQDFIQVGSSISILSKELFHYLSGKIQSIDLKATDADLSKRKLVFTKKLASHMKHEREASLNKSINKTRDQIDFDTEEDLSNIFELSFKMKGAVYKKMCEVIIVIKNFMDVTNKLIYIDLNILDENDPKYIQKQREMERRQARGSIFMMPELSGDFPSAISRAKLSPMPIRPGSGTHLFSEWKIGEKMASQPQESPNPKVLTPVVTLKYLDHNPISSRNIEGESAKKIQLSPESRKEGKQTSEIKESKPQNEVGKRS